ncbi:anthranilate phosphoribosyltransferase [Mumia sp. zg.B53]|uniref:anthranilate phosphoribosyltransferase n=1 Tax=unclassified Mumia TaxID=2621872 RepID=UPI001C6E034E|nr:MULTISPECIES: anthranilate phosphoribosyltransferase [unclassified Mumia]MBW9211420.1 anthranilate phosphoribosyltransferase [Mumia sp. zg.B21]MBW9216593.1 anthranilate phosphoribosyltransferase [Mumia sp. zg.B53]
MTVATRWPEVLGGLVAGEDLTAGQTAWAMEEILSGNATAAQIAGFAVALRAKGETVAEVEGLAATMLDHARLIEVEGRTVDIVGTGGDRAKTVNISTMSAVTMRGAGALVVKHGNRAASSASGAADVLEELGVRLDLTPQRVASLAGEVGITFCFAPVFHSSFRFTAAPRKELGIPTAFNFLGPLTNPSKPAAMAVGVADARMASVVAGVFARRGLDALVFRGDDGLDEITTTTTSRVWVVSGPDGQKSVAEHTFDPTEVGIAPSPPEALRGGDPAFNADVFRRVVAGEQGPVRDAVVLNAAAGLAAYEGGEDDLVTRMERNVARAREALDSGAAREALAVWADASQRES